jgi:hypothetical protein
LEVYERKLENQSVVLGFPTVPTEFSFLKYLYHFRGSHIPLLSEYSGLFPRGLDLLDYEA